MTEIQSASRFWDGEVQTPTHISWMAHPLVREYINESISEPERGWPFDWFQRTYPGRLFDNGLSIGCGTGALERDAIKRGICERIEGIDGSEVSLEIARREAMAADMGDRLTYRRDDFNDLSLSPSAYDIVFFQQSLHHVSRMERLLRQVARSLRPGGLVYLDEFIGPSRTYWTERRTAFYRAAYRLIPREVRFFDDLRMPVQYEDLSEAIRSGEILSRLKIGFHVRHFRGYGGNLLAVLFPSIAPDVVPDSVVASLISAERSMLTAGVEHFHAVIVAEPKRGVSALLASLKYFFDPKFRRLARDMRGIFGAYEPHASEEDRFRI